MVKKYADLYLDARKALLPTEGENAAVIARELLCRASGKTASSILSDRELYASEEITAQMEENVRRILTGEPLAYLLEEWSFYGMTLKVTRDTLIPRDDTMAVTELAVKKALFLEQNPRILDLCTGTGCIGLAIAKRVSDARVTLADLSKAALSVAKQNAAAQKFGTRVNCIALDVMEEAPAYLGKFDLIVSNPPYVTEREMMELPDSVKNFEPPMALYGGKDGLDFYRAIARNYRTALKPGGYLCFEFGMGQEDAVCSILTENGFEVQTTTKDSREITRAVIARLKSEEKADGDEENSR